MPADREVVGDHRSLLRDHLEAALESEDRAEKHFHVRQALQLLEIEE